MAFWKVYKNAMIPQIRAYPRHPRSISFAYSEIEHGKHIKEERGVSRIIKLLYTKNRHHGIHHIDYQFT